MGKLVEFGGQKPQPKEIQWAEQRELVGLVSIILASLIAAGIAAGSNSQSPIHLDATPFGTMTNHK